MNTDSSMNCSLSSLLVFIVTALAANGQTVTPPLNDPGTLPPPEQTGPTLGEVIGSIAEKEIHEPADYEQLAQMTLQLGQSAMQQGQRIPDPSIWDGIHAVHAGQSINPLQTDWDTLREELIKLLEKPPEDQQQDQENQDQENQEQSEDSEDQNESGEQNSESEQNGEDSESQEQENPDEQQGEDQSSQENEGDEEQSQTGDQEGEQEQQQQSESLGDMSEPEETPQLDQKPTEEQTQVGGTEQQPPPRSAKQAMTLQQLEQLKQQDKPGALHMMLQNAERDENAPPPQKLKKDW